jgi:hypothetical protein
MRMMTETCSLVDATSSRATRPAWLPLQLGKSEFTAPSDHRLVYDLIFLERKNIVLNISVFI